MELQVRNAAVTLLPRSVASSLRETVDSNYDVTGYEISKHVPVDDLRAAITVLDGLCRPASLREIGEWIAALYVQTARRKEEQIVLDLAVQVYGQKLSRLPGEAVKSAMEAWPNKSKWWPTWHELSVEIKARDKAGMMRQAVWSAIDAKLAARPDRGQPARLSEVNAMPRAEFIEKIRAENPAAFGVEEEKE